MRIKLDRLVNTLVLGACVLALPLDVSRAAASTSVDACSQGTIEVQPGSELDLGWSGFAHDTDLSSGYSLGFQVLRRCSDDSSVCTANTDCSNDQCVPTCDCVGDPTCEITGPAQRKRCVSTLEECSSEADCPGSTPCVATLGPPIPLSFGGTPICVLSVFDGPLAGTADSATGGLSVSMNLRWRIFLGLAVAQPCPRCGAPVANPKVGQVFTCEGGQFPGADCKADAVSPMFGGTSFDCPPTLASNVSGPGLPIRIGELTTGTSTKAAQLACKQFGFTSNPLNAPGSPGKCIDKMGEPDPVCSSNADCLRCSGDTTLPCTSNADCTGVGTCAEAPDQPIACGFWCHCGFCDGNPDSPCFGDADCADGQDCEQGTGTGTQSLAPQVRPNYCVADGSRCGTSETEKCATTTSGTCSLRSFRSCEVDGDCTLFDAGACILEPRSCFESRVTRTGTTSPLGSYCAIERIPCITNGDCVVETDHCVTDASALEAVALFCSPTTASVAINATAGLAGPATIRINGFLRFCRCPDGDAECLEGCGATPPFCGDGIIQQGEECDSSACCESDCTRSDPGTECRVASGCVLAATCDGEGNLCPQGQASEVGTPCADDGNVCTDDACDGAGACTHAHNADPCDDGDACTSTDTCAGGTCVGNHEPIPECSTTTLPAPLCGDVDGNGEVTASDALATLQVAVGIGDCQPSVCDFSGDGNVTSVDALAVLRAAVDLTSDPQCPLS